MLRNARVGDRVVSHTRGTGKIVSTESGLAEYPIKLTFFSMIECYTITGRRHVDDLHPDIKELIPQHYSPIGGKYLLGLDNNVVNHIHDHEIHPEWTKAGRTFNTYEQAKKAASILGPIQRIVAYVVEQDSNKTELNYTIGYNPMTNEWESSRVTVYPSLLAVIIPMSYETATSLSNLLNNNLI